VAATAPFRSPVAVPSVVFESTTPKFVMIEPLVDWQCFGAAKTDVDARLGQDEFTIDWLRRGFEARSGAMVWIKLYPWFGRLAEHPRFREMSRQIGLPE
jgi:hypothetical protein